MERRIRIKVPYTREFENPIKMSKGSTIRIVKRNDGKYKDWYWCVTEDGVEAFVPDQMLEVEGNLATFISDYDSRELTVAEGEVLISLFAMGGWTWARRSSGEEGWIPDDVAEPYLQI